MGRVANVASDHATGIALVRQGLAVAFIPEKTARSPPGLVALPVTATDVLCRTVSIAASATRRLSPAAQALLDALLDALHEDLRRGETTPSAQG